MTTATEARAVVSEFVGHDVGKLKAVNPTPLLCRAAVRRFLLETAKRERPFNKFKRVSEDTLVAANAELRRWLVSRVKSMPSKGVTL